MDQIKQKRSRIFHFLALACIASSVFFEQPMQKLGVLLVGIAALAIIAWTNRQKVLVAVYAALFIAAILFYLFVLKQEFVVPQV